MNANTESNLNTILKMWLVTITLYTILYFIFSFVQWNFYNPLQWIIDIPNYTELQRFGILSGWILYWFVLYSLSKEIKKEAQQYRSE